MKDLWLYTFMSRSRLLNYRAKIMLMAFVGTHIPLIALVSYFALKSSADWTTFLSTVGVTLAATLIGTGVTLFVLNHLLQPVIMTSRTLRAYKQTRDTGSLPTHFKDEAGTLMADAASTLVHLEGLLDALEFVDGSTGLPNRRRLVLDVANRLSTQRAFAVASVRFGSYQKLAETLDLTTAEAAASEISGRLRTFSTTASVYRISNHDFVVLCDTAEGRPDTSEDVSASVRAMLAACSASMTVQAIAVDPGLVAGICLYPEDGGDTAETIIDRAVSAASEASSRTPVSFHSPQARRAAFERLHMEQELQRALAQDEFVLHYQPVVDLVHGRAVGAEALIRWQHPEKGLMLPARFIPAAEASGIIDPIGLWVMRKSCEQVRFWNENGMPGMKVAINLSARQFLDPHLVRFVDEALRITSIAPDQLEIELTETAAMVDAAHTRAMFGKLRDLGVSIAIDDFGSGYASMSYLRKLPFDKLKIDREFVSNVHDSSDSQAICDALIALARGLKLRLLAEGTETEQEVAFLRERGCHLFQGYFFSKPIAAADFAESLGQVSLSAMAMRKKSGTRMAA